MLFFNNFSWAVAIVLSISQIANASPHTRFLPARSTADHLFTRAITGYVGCSAKQKTRLGQGLADAAVLANLAFGIDATSTAFTHYLRDQDVNLAKSVWSTIARNNDPTNPPFVFTIRCSAGGAECPSGSLAITDATPQSGNDIAQMLICPYFFTAQETKNDLQSKTLKRNPSRRDNSWCQPGQRFSDFETAGHTLLHEMTHLDGVGKAAGLSVRHGTHGTDDVADLGNNYQAAARALKRLWDAGRTVPGTLKPVENAENLAAAATEWYFVKNCGFTEITS